MQIIHLSSTETESLLRALQMARDLDGYVTARVSTDQHGFKVSVNHGMWSPSFGTISGGEATGGEGNG